tara:strand:- start:6653 stop:6787 length:135 start_codon:yes stop_codon:yes gene_type:complete
MDANFEFEKQENISKKLLTKFIFTSCIKNKGWVLNPGNKELCIV